VILFAIVAAEDVEMVFVECGGVVFDHWGLGGADYLWFGPSHWVEWVVGGGGDGGGVEQWFGGVWGYCGGGGSE